jgi:hypothetical protein
LKKERNKRTSFYRTQKNCSEQAKKNMRKRERIFKSCDFSDISSISEIFSSYFTFALCFKDFVFFFEKFIAVEVAFRVMLMMLNCINL